MSVYRICISCRRKCPYLLITVILVITTYIYIYRHKDSSLQPSILLSKPHQHIVQTFLAGKLKDRQRGLNTLLEENSSKLQGYYNHMDRNINRDYFIYGSRSSLGHKKKTEMMSEYWKTVHGEIGRDKKLYQHDLNVEMLLSKMKTAKIVDISFFRERPTIKWMMTLDGGQKVLFKPELNDTSNNWCQSGCEHPAYEVTGFVINRMLGLNTMPFTTSRELDWFSEIQPIASSAFIREFSRYKYDNITKVCVKWRCRHQQPSVYCFPKGRIWGSVMYWVNGDILELRHYSYHKCRYSRYHPFHFSSIKNKIPATKLKTGDSRFCEDVRRRPPYNSTYHFLYMLDMAVEDFLTQSKNSKHNILYLDNSYASIMNVVIDKGKGFCPYKDDLLLAPIYQCCNIRKSVYEALVKFNDTFLEEFMEATRLESKQMLIQMGQVDDIGKRIKVILEYIEKCFNIKGKENVLISKY